MAKIYEMSPHLADLIAAGEVVERPGSVVKELCENSIDAGAVSLTVEIKDGGMSYIRVTDNGCGISAEDAETAFLRHATSKLRTERDLESIGTLGFRGEALAAISAVSRIELLTKETEAELGTRLTLEGGKVTGRESVGCPDGTTMIVRDLFFNTPARHKFMKNDRAEGSFVSSVVTRLALSHPEVSVRYIKDGKEECHTPGDGKVESCVYSTLGREFAKTLLRADLESEGGKVTGYVSAPGACRGNRTWQFFFVNGRFIKSKLLQAALEQAYKNQLFTGRFPVCVLSLEMSPSAVDVNVHPAKTEVRFQDEKKTFDAVYWAVRGALERETDTAEIKVSRTTENTVRADAVPDKSAPAALSPAVRAEASAKPRDGFFKTMSAGTFRQSYGGGSFKTAVRPQETASHTVPVADGLTSSFQTGIKLPDPAPSTGTSYAAEAIGLEKRRELGQKLPWKPDAPIKAEPQTRPWRYIGEAMDTYLIVQKDESIYLIDKHAAHERMLFDRLKKSIGASTGQLLITPLVCSIGGDAAEAILENAELLHEFGFEVDDFGSGTVALRQVPADVDMGDPETFMEEIAEKLTAGGRQGLEAMRDGVMHSVACRAAIKAGKPSDPREVEGLIEKVVTGEIKYCPHGRPVAMEITKAQLDRSFKRA